MAGKKRHSKRLRGARKLEKGVSAASQRIARAVELGVMSWERRRDSSGRAKRDGGLKDAFENSVFAAGKVLRESSWAPTELFSALGRRRDPRRILLRAFLPI
jgi:hypothetical protein